MLEGFTAGLHALADAKESGQHRLVPAFNGKRFYARASFSYWWRRPIYWITSWFVGEEFRLSRVRSACEKVEEAVGPVFEQISEWMYVYGRYQEAHQKGEERENPVEVRHKLCAAYRAWHRTGYGVLELLDIAVEEMERLLERQVHTLVKSRLRLNYWDPMQACLDFEGEVNAEWPTRPLLQLYQPGKDPIDKEALRKWYGEIEGRISPSRFHEGLTHFFWMITYSEPDPDRVLNVQRKLQAYGCPILEKEERVELPAQFGRMLWEQGGIQGYEIAGNKESVGLVGKNPLHLRLFLQDLASHEVRAQEQGEGYAVIAMMGPLWKRFFTEKSQQMRVACLRERMASQRGIEELRSSDWWVHRGPLLKLIDPQRKSHSFTWLLRELSGETLTDPERLLVCGDKKRVLTAQERLVELVAHQNFTSVGRSVGEMSLANQKAAAEEKRELIVWGEELRKQITAFAKVLHSRYSSRYDLSEQFLVDRIRKERTRFCARALRIKIVEERGWFRFCWRSERWMAKIAQDISRLPEQMSSEELIGWAKRERDMENAPSQQIKEIACYAAKQR